MRTTTNDIPERVAKRLFSHVRYLQPDGCIESKYTATAAGYSQIGWNENGRRYVMLGHRVACIVHHGAIPPDMTVDHICKNKVCINIEHLRLLSSFENARRGDRRDWPLGECANGHSNDHLVLRSDGRQACGICLKEWQKRGNERARARHRERMRTDKEYAERIRKADRDRYHAKRYGRAS